MPGPLDGLVVADFSRILAGPYATMLLADLGADVVKVEGPQGDDTRTWTPPVRDGISTYYLGVNRNKRSIALDLKDEADAVVARRLAARADVMIENFRPGGLTRFGLDYDAVSAANPAVVYASISGFGSGEQGAKLPGYDLIVQAISGLMSLTGDPDGPPYRAGISVFDVMAGPARDDRHPGCAAHARGDGQGQHVEVNLLSSALSGLVNQSSAYVAGDTVPFRMGNSHPSLFPYEPLPCSDRDLIVTAGNNAQFRKLVEVLGLPELADDPRFTRNEDRTVNRDELRPLLVDRLRTRTAMEWFDAIIGAGVPCGPINTVDGGFALAESIGLDPVVHVGEGDAACPRPVTRSRSPRRRCATTARRPARRARRRDPRVAGGRMTELRVPDLPRHVDRRRDPAPGPGPDRRPDGQGRLRRAGVLAGGDASPDTAGGPGLRGGAGRARGPRLHADGDRRPADLPLRTRLAAGRAGGRAARRRVALPGRDRGLRALPARGARRRGGAPPPTTPAGTRWRSTPYDAPARPAGTSLASATRCTRSRTPGPLC